VRISDFQLSKVQDQLVLIIKQGGIERVTSSVSAKLGSPKEFKSIDSSVKREPVAIVTSQVPEKIDEDSYKEAIDDVHEEPLEESLTD
jgi:hypothetical protein